MPYIKCGTNCADNKSKTNDLMLLSVFCVLDTFIRFNINYYPNDKYCLCSVGGGAALRNLPYVRFSNGGF